LTAWEKNKWHLLKKKDTLQIGSSAILKSNITVPSGTFEKGTKVTITGISSRGYDFEDEYGNRAMETGFTLLEPNNISNACGAVLDKFRNMSDDEVSEDYNKFIDNRNSFEGDNSFSIIQRVDNTYDWSKLINKEIYDDAVCSPSYTVTSVRYCDNDISVVEASGGGIVIGTINLVTGECTFISDSYSGFYRIDLNE
jgi:hypothetical protein